MNYWTNSGQLPVTMHAGEVFRLRIPESVGANRFLSSNAYVVSVLQNGKLIANGPGFTEIRILRDDDLRYLLSVDVLPGERTYPVLFNRYNEVNVPADTLVSLDSARTRGGKALYAAQSLIPALEALCAEAAAQGLYVHVSQGYRSVGLQMQRIQRRIEREGEQKALRRCAPPRFSEHHTGLALDVGGGRITPEGLVPDKHAVYDWIAENAWKFGFMIKNLPGREHITGTMHEPWHIRWLGDPALAERLYREDLTLDEYLDQNLPVVRVLDLPVP